MEVLDGDYPTFVAMHSHTVLFRWLILRIIIFLPSTWSLAGCFALLEGGTSFSAGSSAADSNAWNRWNTEPSGSLMWTLTLMLPTFCLSLSLLVGLLGSFVFHLLLVFSASGTRLFGFLRLLCLRCQLFQHPLPSWHAAKGPMKSNGGILPRKSNLVVIQRWLFVMANNKAR